jgi:hypothetical protein
MKAYWGSEGIASRVRDLGTDRFTPGEGAPCTHWIGGWMGPRAGLDAVAKEEILAYEGNRIPVVQFVAWSLY